MVKHNEIEENISELSVLLNKIQTYIAGLECGKRIEECVAREDYSSTDLIEIKKIPLAPVAYTRYRCPCNPGAFIERYSQLQSLMEKHQLHRAGPLMAIFHDHYTQFDYKDADIEVCVPIAEKALIDLSRVYSFQKSLAAFRNMFLLIESEQLKDDYLSTLKSELYNQAEPASICMKRLERISDAINFRYNLIFYFIFNLFLFWDFHCAVYLERWKIQNAKKIRTWFETIGAFEALTSLSVISHIHPEWGFPELQDHGMKIHAQDFGHPLIQSEKCVRNDIEIDKYSCIITGSNMSGKSTFLRAIGMNLVLAYAGTAVCARKFRCSIMDVYTSMVIRDDLINGISTFYAELTRINMILKQADKGQPMLYLIDEIFRGTNSLDRIAGAQVVLRELSKKNVIGLISTHDFELCGLEKDPGLNFRNYHFEEQYIQGRIEFDYKLRSGRCTTSNARYLMNMVGIHVPE
jgi:hypothetical protein